MDGLEYNTALVSGDHPRQGGGDNRKEFAASGANVGGGDSPALADDRQAVSHPGATGVLYGIFKGE